MRIRTFKNRIFRNIQMQLWEYGRNDIRKLKSNNYLKKPTLNRFNSIQQLSKLKYTPWYKSILIQDYISDGGKDGCSYEILNISEYARHTRR